MPEPDLALARRLLNLGRRDGDRELVQRLLTDRGLSAESHWLDMRAAERAAASAFAWAVHRTWPASSGACVRFRLGADPGRQPANAPSCKGLARWQPTTSVPAPEPTPELWR